MTVKCIKPNVLRDKCLMLYSLMYTTPCTQVDVQSTMYLVHTPAQFQVYYLNNLLLQQSRRGCNKRELDLSTGAMRYTKLDNL